ncbi:glycoside hydrolase family 30 protein [Lacibacter sp. H407]|uniref:glycoside hydrolase family 30 protein n=1 Tax=Lacibacter sp. H407 TaxID=3133423 RepID=UPI0030C63BE6
MKQKINWMTGSLIVFAFLSLNFNCKKKGNSGTDPETPGAEVNWWMTTGSRTALLQKQTSFAFNNGGTAVLTIEVDSAQTYQTVDGFGYTFTEGSAYLINKLNATEKNNLLQELFGSADNSINVNYLRLGIGATDLSTKVYSYNDLPSGQTDLTLAQFTLGQDTVDVIPVLKQILAINPNIKLMASPWSAPSWMKDNNSSIGGRLKTEYYSVYAQYFVKYIQAMKAKGITIDAITIQNEPLHGGNNPSMLMNAVEQANFIKNHLGPAFQTANITTKIVLYDHNCDRPDYPIAVLNDAVAKPFIDGSAFHLYAGDIVAMSTVHDAHPDKNLYFTEQWTGASGSFDGDLKWHVKNVVIGSMRNWSKVALNWNLANDGSYNPHTPGGCDQCKGALTLDGAVNRNVSYYVIGHASKFIPTGSKRIASTQTGNLYSAAFLRNDGKKVLLVLNDGSTNLRFNIKYKGANANTMLSAGAVATYVW